MLTFHSNNCNNYLKMENSDKMNQQMQEVMSKKPSEIMCSILDEYKVMVDNIR